jgi:hypothetical protein
MALASRGSIRVTVALWPAGYEMPRMKSVKKAQIPPPPPRVPIRPSACRNCRAEGTLEGTAAACL